MDGHSTCTSALRLAAAATAVLLVLPSSAVRAPSDASRVDARLLAAAVGAEWSETLRGTFAADGLEVEAVPGEDAVEMRVSPPKGADSSFFRAVAR